MTPHRRRATRRRALLLAVAAGWGLLLTALAWLGVTAYLVRGEAAALQRDLAQLQSQVEAGDLAAAQQTAAALQQHAQRAHQLTTGPVWAMAAALPYVGAPLETARGTTAATADLAEHGLTGLIDAAGLLQPDQLRAADGTVSVERIAAAGPAIAQAHLAAVRALAAIEALPHRTWLTRADDARAMVQTKLSTLTTTLASADRAARIAPTLLGATTPQRIFLGFQNDAEARGTGGLPGAFAILVVDHGRFDFTHFESDDYLRGTPADPNGLDESVFGRDFALAYRALGATTVYQNTNLSAHFPYAAQLWAAMWQAKSGERVDAAIAVDPTALSYLLRAAGPTQLPDGTPLRADDIVQLTQSTAYARFGDDQDARKQFLTDIARAASEHLLDPGIDAAALLRQAARAGGERRLLIWSADQAVQQELAATAFAGAVPVTADPYAGFTVNNAGGNKLDYYLDRSMTWSADGCGPTRRVTVSLTLTNSAPTSGLSDYVAGRLDRPPYPVGPVDNIELVSYYATAGSQLVSATLDGQPLDGVVSLQELGHPMYRVGVELPAGQSRTITLTLEEPTTGAEVTILRQPLVRALAVDVAEPGRG